MNKSVNKILNIRFCKIIIYISILWFAVFPFDLLAGSITGESKVCAYKVYTYKIDPGIYTILDSDWGCSSSGHIVREGTKTCDIYWDGVGELKVTVKVNLILGLFGGFWDYYTKTVSYKDIGEISNLNIINESDIEKSFFCTGESAKLSFIKNLNSDYSYTYKWVRYFNGSPESTETTLGTELSYTLPKSDGEYKYIVYALETDGCKSNELSETFKVKSSALQNIDIDVVGPTCNKGRDTKITLKNIPDYSTTYLFNKYPGNGDYTVTMSKYDSSYLDGYTTNYTFSYAATHVMDSTAFKLIDQNTEYNYSYGLMAGDYEIQIENSYFCEEKRDLPTIEEPLEFKIGNVIEYLGNYSYDSKIYNIQTNTGTDQIKLSLVNGNGNPVTYYIDDSPFTTSNLQDEVILSGINGAPHDIYAVDGDGCKTVKHDIDLEEPAPFKIDLVEAYEPSCHENNDGTSDNGSYLITVSGGIGPYKLKRDGEEIARTSDSDLNIEKYKLGNTGPAETFNVQVIDIAQTINRQITIPAADELDLTIFDVITSECSGYNDGELKVTLSGRVEDYYTFNITGGESSKYIYPSGDIAHFTLLETNTIYDVTVGVVKEDTDGTKLFECKENKTQTFTGYADTLGFNIFDTIPPTCYNGIDGKIILEPFGGHQDGNYDYSNFSATIIKGSYFPAPSIKNSGSNVLIDTIRSFVEYEIEITDDEGCNTINTIRVARNQNPVQFQFLDSAEIQCNKYDNGWVELEGLGGLASSYGYDYYIFPEYEFFSHTSETPEVDTSIVKYGNDITFYNLSPGYFDIYVADSNDCLHPDIICDKEYYKKQIYVYEPPIIDVEYWNTGVSQKGEADAKLWFVADGGNFSFIYELESADTLCQVVVQKILLRLLIWLKETTL